MSGISSGARTILRTHLRTLLPVGAAVVVGALALLILTVLYAQLIGATAYQQMVASIDDVNSWTSTVVLVMAPLIVLALIAALVWAGIITERTASKKPLGMPGAAWRSLRRAPKAVAIVLITLLAVVAGIIATPVLIIVGLVYLFRRQRRLELLIPFGLAARTIKRWSLALPAVWADGATIRGAFTASTERARWWTPLVVLAAFLISGGLTEGAAALTGDPGTQLVIRIAALLVLAPLPFVTLGVLYRGDRKPTVQHSRPMSKRARIASAVTASLLLPLVIGVAPSPAQAAGTTVDLTQFQTHTLTGEAFLLVAQVTGSAPTGDVQLTATPATGPAIDLGTFPLSGDQIVQAIGATLPAGQYQLTARYLGDPSNPAATSTALTHTITAPTADISVTSVPGAGDTATLTITVAPQSPATTTPTGIVQVNGGALLPLNGSGVATTLVDVSAAGTRELPVAYSGDSYYGAANALYTVPRQVTSINLFGDMSRSFTYGATQLFEGSVSGSTTPTGTVELWWQNVKVASGTVDASGRFSFSTTALNAGSGQASLEYVGDAAHAPSSSAPIALAIAKANAIPVVGTTAVNVGDDATLTSGLPAAATGTVTYYTGTNQLIGTADAGDGLRWLPDDIRMFVKATYAGDRNYIGGTSVTRQIDLAPAAVTVTITDPGTISYGDVFTLAVKVKVGAAGIKPDHTIDFVTPAGGALASNVYVTASGDASQVFCARATGCPADSVVLGTNDSDVVAKYGTGSNNTAGQATYQYRPAKAATTTTLQVTPTNILFGSGVTLRAEVTNPNVTPTGLVDFYGVDPDGTLTLIKEVALTAGVAEWTTQSGEFTTDLHWPQNKVKAVYLPDFSNFLGSSKEVAITLGRMSTSLDVVPVTPLTGVRTPVTVNISHEPGTSAQYRGSVTITTDEGEICTVYPNTANSVTCSFTWTTTGTHSVTTSFTGDVVYLPVLAATTNLTVGTVIRTPNLRLAGPSAALVGDDVTVTWSHDPTMTGTVTVTGDGATWCTAAITADSCTGRFGNASGGGLREVRLQWPGDAGWYGASERILVSVTRCAILDVRSNDTSLGTVRVDTAPNCGASGYLPGTSVQVTATPKSPGQFAYWQGYRPPAPGLVLVSSTATTTFTVSTDSQTWVRVARFELPCGTITPLAAGYGGISVYPAPNCAGGRYVFGTKVAIYPDGHYNPVYDEPDGFWDFGAVPAGAVVTQDSSNRPYVNWTVTGDATIRVNFGPVCRSVNLTFSPASPGDAATLDPLDNCSSPRGGGYLRGTTVTAHAVPGDPSMAITGWTLNGAPAPELGTTSDPVVTIDQVEPVLVATVVHCYVVDVKLDSVTDRNNQPTGAVKIDGTACPDGSDRYLGGTSVTLTPQVLAAGTLFNGWDETRTSAVGPAGGGTGDVTQAARTFVLTADVHTTAGFFDKSACSSLINAAAPGIIGFEASGCGPGYYLDARKQQSSAEGIPMDQLTGDKYLTSLRMNVTQPGALPMYVSVHGDATSCGNSTLTPGLDGWSFLGAKKGGFDCKVSGPVIVDADACQPVITDPTFSVKGRDGSFGADAMPGTFYVTGPDGVVRPVSGFEWGKAVPVKPAAGGKYSMSQAFGTCGEKSNLFLANTDVLLYAAAPSSGFSFDGWTGFGATPVKGSPLHRVTDDTTASLNTGAKFTVSCATVTFGEGIHIDGDAPRCPGSSESDNSFILGTSIMVRADYQLGDRTVQKFSSGVAGNQIYEDPTTLDLVGFAYVGQGTTNVTGLYQNRTDRVNTEIIKGLKFGVGIIAVVAPVVIGMLVPPVGIFFGAVGAIAGISGVIPGGENVAAVFDLVNPTKITNCIARWGFNNAGTPGSQNVGSILSTTKTVATAVFTDTDVLVQNIGSAGVLAGAGSIALGLYSAGIGNANLVGPTSVEELRDTATIQACLDHVWRITDGGAPSPAG